MKKFLTLFSILIIGASSFSFATDKIQAEREAAQGAFSRMIESAHPTPSLKKRKLYPIPQKAAVTLPYFLNVNTIDDEGTDPQKMQNESSIAVNPTNPLNLIASAVDYRAESSAWVYVSHDGGKTWVNINLGKPYPDWRSSNDPSVMFDVDGTGYLVYGAFGTFDPKFPVLVGENGVYMAKTTDEGKTWKAHIPVIQHTGAQGLDSTFEDKYYIQVDNSPSSPNFHSLYIPWKRVTPRDSATQIVISKSTDKGETWSIPVNVSSRLPGSSEDTTFGQSFPLTATGPDGEVYVVWNHGPKHSVGFAKSIDGGKTFTAPRLIKTYNRFGIATNIKDQGFRHTVKGVVRAESYPVIQCDISNGPRNGWLYLSWTGDPIPNVYFARSTDGGDKWTDSVIVHSDTTNDQFWHWMSVDPMTGDLGIMYLDSRNDPNNLMVECFVSYSSDGGTTWRDKRAADVSSDLRLNPFTANSFAGDYSGNAFYNGKIYPSWIDMRSAVANINDSDVYTAIVNVNAPAPPDNLKAEIIPEEPQKINLTWINPTTKSFGQALDAKDYKLRLLRNGAFLATLESNVTSYPDAGLTAFTKYKYELYTVTSNDSSIARLAEAYAGGSKQPAAPKFISIAGKEDRNVSIYVKLPSFRLDAITPLANLAKLELYRDGLLVKTLDVAKTDTGKVIEVIDLPTEQGWYRYSMAVLDATTTPNRSPFSDTSTIYTGPFDTERDEKFDAVLPHYLIEGGWAQTNEFVYSSPNSLTESPNKDYVINQRSSFTLFPIRNNKDYVVVKFMNAAIVESGDRAMLQYSIDGGQTWKNNDVSNQPMVWDKTKFAPWADGMLTAADWRQEAVTIDGKNTDSMIVRFRFESNPFKNNNGWFIDDVSLSLSKTDVEEIASKPDLKVYPNPAGDWINISFSGSSASGIRVEVRDIFGVLRSPASMSINEASGFASLGVNNLPTGTYFISITSDGVHYTRKAEIVR